jgi:tetratricopeptide (TPR) repeat protein
MKNDSTSSRWIAGGSLVLIALLAYFNSFSTPFLFDDHESIEENPTIQRLNNVVTVLRPPANGSGVTGRPVVNLSLAINYAISGTNERSYHWLNFAVHSSAMLVLFGLVRRTLRLPPLQDRFARKALPFAWVVAAVWSVHPLQTESVTCVVQRTELLVGLFYLLTLYAFVRSVQSPWPRVWLALAVIACLLGMGSKEVMVSAPLMVLLFDRTFVAGSFGAAWRERRRFYVSLGSTWILLAYLVLSGGGTRGASAGFGLGVSPLAYAFKQCEAIVRYLWLSIWPHPLVLDYGESLAVHPVGVWLAAGVLAVLVGVVALALRRRPILGFVGVWFFVILAPSSSVVPLVTQTIAEHRMYLPLAGVVVLLTAGVDHLVSNPRRAVPVAVIAVLGLLTARRNFDYRSSVAIWTDTVGKSPRNSRAHHNLGVALAQLPGRSADAIASFRNAIACKPTDVLAHYSLAHELAKMPGGRALAFEQYEIALRIDPRHQKSHVNLANLLAEDPTRIPEAIVHYEIALQLKPDDSRAHNNLANELAKVTGRSIDAFAHYREALRIRPDDPEVHFNFAGLLARFPDGIGDAIRHYERAVELRPNFLEAHYRLANELAKQSERLPDAIGHYQAVLRIDPTHAAAHFNLAVVCANVGQTDESIRHFESAVALKPDWTEARQNLELMQSIRRNQRANR